MNQRSFLISIILSTSLILFSCKKNEAPQSNEYQIQSGACGTIDLRGNIGGDFQTALDSLENLQQSNLVGGCPDQPCFPEYYLDIDTISVDFEEDNREFMSVSFNKSTDDLPIFSMSDVVDSHGNLYKINWCTD